jgi:hypothetical protein
VPSSEPFTRADTMHGSDHDCVCCAYARTAIERLREAEVTIERLTRENQLLGNAVLTLRETKTIWREMTPAKD